MWLFYFIFYSIFTYLFFVSELIPFIVCRWLTLINQLLYHNLLEKLYIKFIHIFTGSFYLLAVIKEQRRLSYKMYKKILCQTLPLKGKGWMVNQQVRSLSFNYEVTSETECDITFKFNNYLNQKVQHKKKINKLFLEWFIGITEGKGSFIVLNNKIYFDISVSIKDIQVIYYIRKELGFGKVRIKDLGHQDPSDTGGTVSFYVTSKDNFTRLVSLFNGNLCTVNKKQDFKNWLKIYNNQYSKEIVFIDRVIKPSLNTGWLSGYIDALGPREGNFTSLTAKRAQRQNKEFNSKTFYLKFSILAEDKKEFYILNDISVILNSIKNIKHKDREGWILSISSFNKLKLIVNYLKRYPLKTQKSLAFTVWCKIYNIILKKEHLNEIGLNKIYSLSLRLKEMNK